MCRKRSLCFKERRKKNTSAVDGVYTYARLYIKKKNLLLLLLFCLKTVFRFVDLLLDDLCERIIFKK